MSVTAVIQVIKEVLNVNEADINDTLEDLGADSLDLMELMIELENAFDVDISDEQALEAKTVKDVVERVMELAHAGRR